MPLYEYECRKCRRRTERIEKVAGPHLRKCPHCGASVERLLTAAAIQFKGSGWYVTDYSRKSAAPEAAKPKESAAKDSAAPADAKSKESPAKEKKPAAGKK